ncbi:MAG: hypothetical protein K2Y30_03520 [Flavobacteriaceae bacterium]|nr:hypothetical protein [Flavobacteriaceae bacterium]
MRLNIKPGFKKYTVEVICILYILLFVYAAVSKLLQIEHFRIQIGKSPLLSAFAEIVAWGVPISEIVISLLLMMPKLRRTGLWLAMGLMSMFTTYIFIILNFSSYIPCSCGGILEKMGWKEHLIFNLVFVFLAAIALWFSFNEMKQRFIKFSVLASSNIALASLIVIVLFLLSEEEVHRNNAFLRRYPHHPAVKGKSIELKYNSYYIAGFNGKTIFLGNSSAPLHLLEIDTSMQNIKSVSIDFKNPNKYKFSNAQIRIEGSKFFLYDGTVPVIYHGQTKDWQVKREVTNKIAFSQLVPIDNGFGFRQLDKKKNLNILGVFENGNPIKVSRAELLTRQTDGIFDTDGLLIYNAQLDKIIYNYYYRNTFVVADAKNIQSSFQGKTIDTVSWANIKIAKEDSSRVHSMIGQPPLIQKWNSTWGKYLFVSSERLGKYESKDALKNAVIVDVYNLRDRSYEFSFYLYNHEKEKVIKFKVCGDLLVGLTNHYVVLYRLDDTTFEFK